MDHALAAQEDGASVGELVLGADDVGDRFELPQKLYGRGAERDELLAAFDRVANGARELFLVSGTSGIGKSALVHEVHRPILERRGTFIEGKFDQFRRDLPYASLIQAFREIVGQLLSEPPASLSAWRQRIQDAVGVNGQVIVDVIAEVELVLGPQPAVAELPPAEAHNRFHHVFEAFARTFAAAEHPLVLFLDDLQWADPPSLQLLSRLLTDERMTHVLVLGAYRDNEVSDGHPLLLTLDRIRRQGTPIQTIHLQPLGLTDVADLLADALHQSPAAVAGFARTCRQRTAGNPFFLSQFLLALCERQAICFDPTRREWTWDEAAIAASGITDNVVDLMAAKIRTLSDGGQDAIIGAALLGASFDLATLAIALQCSPAAAAAQLMAALSEGLIVPRSGEWMLVRGALDDQDGEGAVEAPERIHYRFLHDRVQQAAASLLSDEARAARQLTIGRRLVAALDEGAQAERVFDIVAHYNAGRALLEGAAERRGLLHRNLLRESGPSLRPPTRPRCGC